MTKIPEQFWICWHFFTNFQFFMMPTHVAGQKQCMHLHDRTNNEESSWWKQPVWKPFLYWLMMHAPSLSQHTNFDHQIQKD